LAALVSVGLAQEPVPQETAPQAAQPEQAPVSVIREIILEKVEIADQVIVKVRVEGPFLIETFSLLGPKRLVIDFHSVSKIEAQPILEVNAMGLLSIRTGQFQPTVARVVFDLDARVPSHSIATQPDGVKVVFWQETAPEPEPEPEKPEPTPQQPALKPAAKAVVPILNRPNMFVRLGPGGSLFLKPGFTVTSDFDLYGETATLTEILSQQPNLLLDLSLGKQINPKFSAGLGVSLQMLYAKPSLEASLPHPFLFDTYREVAFEAEDLMSNMFTVSSEEGAVPVAAEKLTSNMFTVYAWGLYSLFQTEKIDISAGPVLGLSFGMLYSLDDFEITEEAPYESENVTVSSTTFLENKFFKIDPGFLLSGVYALNDKLSAFATLRVHYVDVMVEALERRASLFRLSLVLGLEYGF
jgi:hypothetical protein